MNEIVPSNFGEAFKLRCFAMYCGGATIEQIVEQTGVPKDIIKKWVKTEDWDAERETARLLAKEVVRDDVALDIVGTQAKHLQMSRRVQRIVSEAISQLEEEGAPWKSVEEIAKVLKMAVEIERNAVIGSIEENFVLEIMTIIKEEIQDKEVLNRIIERLRAALAKTKK
jgi:transposase-like protein